jgi:uncharacterized protein (DUF1697 family)
MASVVFLRGVNVGGHKAFQPSVVAKALSDFDVVNVGAAGTFVVRKPGAQRTLLREFQRCMPFSAEVMICPGSELVDLACGEFPGGAVHETDTKRFVSVLAKRPRPLPKLPISQPAGEEWQVKIVSITGKFALSLWRRVGRALIYPNEVVEKRLGVAATTRNWNTIVAICKILKGG